MTGLFLTVVEITVAMSAFIALLLLFARLLGGRFTAKCRYIVWAVVVVRLCVPFGAAYLPSLITVDIPSETEVVYETGTVGQLMPATPSDMPVPPVNVNTAPIETFTPDTADGYPAPAQPKLFNLPSAAKLIEYAGYIWLAAALTFAAVKLTAHFAYTSRLGRGKRHADAEINEIYAALCAKMKLRRPPRLYVSDKTGSPLLYGFLKPCIIVPPDIPAEGAEGILAHELTHYRRGDLWMKLICLTAQSVHCFNPLAHIAASRCCREMELSCDETVLAGIGEEGRREYGGVMLDIIKRCGRRGAGLTTQFNPRGAAVRERFANILDMGGKRRGILIITAAVLLSLVAGAVVGCNLGTTPDIDNENVGEDTEPEIIADYDDYENLAAADINGDGADEILLLKLSDDISENHEFAVLSKGEIIYTEEAGEAHAGWNNLYLCDYGDKKCLLRYNPTVYQGVCHYAYELFSLDESGKPVIITESSIDFDINGYGEYDIEAMLDFADEVNGLLMKSTTLVSTGHGSLMYGADAPVPLEEYDFVNDVDLDYGGSTRLSVKLKSFNDYMRKLMEESDAPPAVADESGRGLALGGDLYAYNEPPEGNLRYIKVLDTSAGETALRFSINAEDLRERCAPPSDYDMVYLNFYVYQLSVGTAAFTGDGEAVVCKYEYMTRKSGVEYENMPLPLYERTGYSEYYEGFVRADLSTGQTSFIDTVSPGMPETFRTVTFDITRVDTTGPIGGIGHEYLVVAPVRITADFPGSWQASSETMMRDSLLAPGYGHLFDKRFEGFYCLYEIPDGFTWDGNMATRGYEPYTDMWREGGAGREWTTRNGYDVVEYEPTTGGRQYYVRLNDKYSVFLMLYEYAADADGYDGVLRGIVDSISVVDPARLNEISPAVETPAAESETAGETSLAIGEYADRADEILQIVTDYGYNILYRTPYVGYAVERLTLDSVNIAGKYRSPEGYDYDIVCCKADGAYVSGGENGIEYYVMLGLYPDGVAALGRPVFDGEPDDAKLQAEALRLSELYSARKTDSIDDISEFITLNTEQYGEFDARCQFIDAFIKGDTARLELLTLTPYGFYSAYSTLRLSPEYRVYVDREWSEHAEYIVFEFDILESGLETLPPGHYRRVLEEGMTGIAAYPYEKETASRTEAQQAIDRWLGTCNVYAPFDGKEPGEQNYDSSLMETNIGDYIGSCYGEKLTLDRYRELALAMFGVENADPGSILYEENGYYHVGGHGGEHWVYDFEPDRVNNDGTITVTVRFYADYNATIPSLRVEYKLEELTEYGRTEGGYPYWRFAEWSVMVPENGITDPHIAHFSV